MRNRPYGFEIYLVNFKTISTIAHIFVIFLEKLNFKEKIDKEDLKIGNLSMFKSSWSDE